VGKPSLRIRSASSFELQSTDRHSAMEAFKAALESACRGNPLVRSEEISVDGESLRVTIELEADSWSAAEDAVLLLIRNAVESAGGRMLSETDSGSEGSTATFEQLGTYLVPA